MCLSFLSEDKGANVEPLEVSKINISAQSGSNVSAPLILNSTVTGNINISNYFPGEWKCFSDGGNATAEHILSIIIQMHRDVQIIR